MNLNFKYITTLSAHVTRILQGLIILILVARQYEVSVFADYIFITTISGIILRVLRSGVDTYYFSTFSEKKDLRLTVLFVCFILLMSVVGVIIVTSFFFIFSAFQLLVISGFIFVFVGEIISGSLLYVYDSNGSNIRGNCFQIVAFTLQPIVFVILVWYTDSSLATIVFASSGTTLLVFIAAFFYFFKDKIRTISIREYWVFFCNIKRSMWLFIVPLIPLIVLGEASRLLDQLLLKTQFEDIDIAVTGIGLRLVTLMTILSTNYIRIFWKNSVNTPVELRFKYFSKVILNCNLVGIVLVIILSVSFGTIVTILYGEIYAENTNLYRYFSIMGLVTSNVQIINTYIFSFNATKLYSRVALPMEIFSMCLAYVMISFLGLGPTGIALRSIVIGTLTFLLLLYYSRNLSRQDDP